MSTHELKTDPDVFEDVYHGLKTFEIRFNDRNFQVGDTLILRRTIYSGEEMEKGKPLIYSGHAIHVAVMHIMHGPTYGLMDGWCIMSIALGWGGMEAT